MTLNEKKAYKKMPDLQRYHKNLSLIVFILKKNERRIFGSWETNEKSSELSESEKWRCSILYSWLNIFFFRLKFHRYHWNSFLTLPSLQKKGSLKIRFTVPSSKYWGFLQLSGVFNVFKTMVWIPPPESWSGPSFTRNIREHPQNF